MNNQNQRDYNFTSSIQATNPILTYKDEDFTYSSKELICLKDNSCVMILFHTNNIEEKNLFDVWYDVSSKNPGAKLGECNTLINKSIAEAFVKVKQDCNHPFFWAGVNQYPFILVYRGGWPQAFYNGNRTTADILNYSLQLACKACYSEHTQTFKGVQVDYNKQITSDNPKEKDYKSSSEFKNSDYRGYRAIRGDEQISGPPGSESKSTPINKGPQVNNNFNYGRPIN